MLYPIRHILFAIAVFSSPFLERHYLTAVISKFQGFLTQTVQSLLCSPILGFQSGLRSQEGGQGSGMVGAMQKRTENSRWAAATIVCSATTSSSSVGADSDKPKLLRLDGREEWADRGRAGP